MFFAMENMNAETKTQEKNEMKTSCGEGPGTNPAHWLTSFVLHIFAAMSRLTHPAW